MQIYNIIICITTKNNTSSRLFFEMPLIICNEIFKYRSCCVVVPSLQCGCPFSAFHPVLEAHINVNCDHCCVAMDSKTSPFICSE